LCEEYTIMVAQHDLMKNSDLMNHCEPPDIKT
jgi:hypothetical protein